MIYNHLNIIVSRIYNNFIDNCYLLFLYYYYILYYDLCLFCYLLFLYYYYILLLWLMFVLLSFIPLLLLYIILWLMFVLLSFIPLLLLYIIMTYVCSVILLHWIFPHFNAKKSFPVRSTREYKTHLQIYACGKRDLWKYFIVTYILGNVKFRMNCFAFHFEHQKALSM